VHPEILTSYLDGALALAVERSADAAFRGNVTRMKPEEVAVLAFLKRRLRTSRLRPVERRTESRALAKAA
jgi:DNA topoisomerase-1